MALIFHLLLLRSELVCWISKDGFGSFHQRFRQRWMGVNGIRQIASRRAHLDSQDRFGNHLASARADDADAEHSLLGRFDNDLCDTFRASQRLGST